MKPCLVVTLVLFFLFVNVKGIRLEKEFQSLVNQRIQEKKISRLSYQVDDEVIHGGVNIGDNKVVLCKDGQCSSGKGRKLIPTITTSFSFKKNGKFGRTRLDDDSMSKIESSQKLHGDIKEKFSTKFSTISKHGEAAIVSGRSTDIIDIAGMDYTTARRKPPIHN